MPDKIRDVLWAVTKTKTISLPGGSVKAMVNLADEQMHKTGSCVWGLSPSQDMRNADPLKVSRKFGLVQGCFFGEKITHGRALKLPPNPDYLQITG